ncbi:hypothetical protein IEO21_04683 [Rhodonia placenta]|uniref:Uncharacterized protein n=1 Tax=Rhodonia placenta TaxID=104341 RepID=A0A8H7U304_9APHY|nr:hypothetical protein IEO21_04683 [Postia placenta]
MFPCRRGIRNNRRHSAVAYAIHITETTESASGLEDRSRTAEAIVSYLR